MVTLAASVARTHGLMSRPASGRMPAAALREHAEASSAVPEHPPGRWLHFGGAGCRSRKY